MSGTHDASGSYVGFYAFAGVAGFLVVTATIFIVIHRCRRQYQHERLPVDVVAVEMGAADANTTPARRPRYPEAQPSHHHVEIFARQPPVPGNVILRDRDDLLQLKGCVRRIEVVDEDRTERGDVSPALPNSSMMPSFALGNSFFYRTGANSLDETNRTNTNHSPEHSPFYSSVGTNNHPNSSSAARRGLWSSSAMHTQSQERLSGVEVQEDRWRVASSVPINLHHGPLPSHETPPKPPLPPPPATTAASADFIFTVELPPMRCAANNVSSSPSSTGRLLVPLREVHAPSGEVSPSTTPRGLHGLYDGGLLPPLSPPLIPHDAPGGTYPPQRFTSTHTNQTPQHFDASVHHMDDAFSTHGLHLVPPHIQTHHREKNFRSHRHQHHLNHDRGSIKNAKKHNTTRRLRDITKGGYLVYERDLSGDAVVEDAALHEAEEEVELPDGLRPAQSGNTGGASRNTKKYYLQKASSFDVYGRGAYLEEPMGAVLPDDAYSPTQHSSSLSSSRPYSPVIVSASSLASSRRAEHSPPNRSRLMDGAGPLCEDARTRGGRGRDDVDVGGTRVVDSPSSPHPVGTPTDSALCSPTSAARGYLFPAPHHD